MTYVEEKRRARRRKKLKKMIIRFCVYSVLAGMILGFFIGRVSVYGEEVPEVKVVEDAIEETEVVEEVKYYDCPLSEDLQDYIRTLCEENNVPMDLVIAQIQVESNFKADCVSGTSDYGLMQINKINHGWLKGKYGITDFLDPYDNVLCGIKILAGHLENNESLEKALMSYNMGTAGADKLWKQGIHTTKYVEKIKSAMSQL